MAHNLQTAQDIFDTVATHLLTQGAKALSSDEGRCVYKAPDGLQCAVGCLIKDEHYSEYFEDLGADNFRVLESLELSGVGTLGNLDLLGSLQNIHDTCQPDLWYKSLGLLADDQGLNKDCLKAFEAVVSEYWLLFPTVIRR